VVEIKIKVDEKNKTINQIDMPEELSNTDISIIMQQISLKALSEKDKVKILKPNKGV
jgi:hypothetical protein